MCESDLVYCPLCRRHYQRGGGVCPVDGTRLLKLSAPLPEKGNIIEGRFILLSRIGGGGMAEIYRSLDTRTRRECAVKLLRPEFNRDDKAIRQFFSEARAIRQIRHRNIVRIMAFGTTADGYPYMVMELLKGRTLAAAIQEHGRLDVLAAVSIFMQLMDALAAAHSRKVIHRDLKPENIYLIPGENREPLIKLLDFGIAQLRGQAAMGDAEICGTPSYMSPEQVRGQTPTPSSDLYSAGVVFFEMLTGKTPFQGPRPIDTLKCHLRTRAPRITSVNESLRSWPRLELLVARLLAKRAQQRPGSAREVNEDLIEIFGDLRPREEGRTPRMAAAGPEDAPRVQLSYLGRRELTPSLHLVTPDSSDFRAYLELYLRPTLMEDQQLWDPYESSRPKITHGAAIQFDPRLEEADRVLQDSGQSLPEKIVARELTMLHARIEGEIPPDMDGDVRSLLSQELDSWYGTTASRGGIMCHDVGDSFKVIFGLSGPRGSEPATRSAILAAEALARSVEVASLRLGLPLAVRMGLVTDAIHGEGEDESELVWVVDGSSLDLSVRLSGIAPRGGIVMDSRSRELLAGACMAEELTLLRVRSNPGIQKVYIFQARIDQSLPKQTEVTVDLGIEDRDGAETPMVL